jgi:hypothetical protein
MISFFSLFLHLDNPASENRQKTQTKNPTGNLSLILLEKRRERG